MLPFTAAVAFVMFDFTMLALVVMFAMGVTFATGAAVVGTAVTTVVATVVEAVVVAGVVVGVVHPAINTPAMQKQARISNISLLISSSSCP